MFFLDFEPFYHKLSAELPPFDPPDLRPGPTQPSWGGIVQSVQLFGKESHFQKKMPEKNPLSNSVKAYNYHGWGWWAMCTLYREQTVA